MQTVKDNGKLGFFQKVILVVKCVPRGSVVSYGQVALYLGLPGAARQVGWVLRRAQEADLPWWRVINNQGRISIKGHPFVNADIQRELLSKEGVVVNKRYEIEIEKYRFKANQALLSKWARYE
jgi:methylated-DNA-protein-cysteine methyltransferase-like protein